ncbi:MAG: endonuclease/exonuclease/phosphatase family protein [bacterium]
MKIYLVYNLFFIALLVISTISCAQKKYSSFYIAAWNVENFYDTKDDPATEDEEFLPYGEKEWTFERYQNKLKNLAKVINLMNDGDGPDILGLIEVENRIVLEELTGEYLIDRNYEIIHYDMHDGRGIDNALIYDADVFKVIESDIYEVKLSGGAKTRDILHVNLQSNNGKSFHVFVNHWPSRSGGLAESEFKRIAAAEVLKKRVDKLFAADKDAQIIIIGDFNDEPDNVSLSKILGADNFNCVADDASKPALLNLAAELDKKNLGTYLYKQNWNMLDQIIISNSFLDNSGWEYKCDSFEIIKPNFMVTRSGDFKGAAWPTYGGRRYLGGYSDHFPVGSKFIFIK